MSQPENRTVRCEDVSKAIAVPEAGDDSSWLAGHLSSCPGCASFARSNATLNGLWESTRPVEPSDAAWDSVWSGINAGLDRAARPAIVPFSAPRRWWSRRSVALVLARAALILLAVTLLWNRPGHSPVKELKPDFGPVARVKVPEVEISEGQFSLIRQDGDRVTLHTIEIAQGESGNAVDSGFEFLGVLEDMVK